MMEDPTQTLRPWIEDRSQPGFVRELLEAGRACTVADYDVQRGLRQHLARIAVGAPMPDWGEGLRPDKSAASAAGAAAGSAMTGWLAGLLLVAIALAPASRQAVKPKVATQPSIAVTAQQAPPRAALATPLTAPGIGPAEARAAAAPPASALLASPLRAQRAERGGARAETRSASLSANPSAKARGESTALANASKREQAVEREPVAAAQAAVTPQQQALGEPTAPSEPAAQRPAQDDVTLEREMMMLAVAQRELASNPERALELAGQGEAEFTGSMFTQERQQVLLLSLVKLGRLDEAKRLARPFLARYAQGPFSDRVRRALATGRVEH